MYCSMHPRCRLVQNLSKMTLLKNLLASMVAVVTVLMIGISASATQEVHEERYNFNILISNLHAGSLNLVSRDNGKSYAVRAILQTEGLLDLITPRVIDLGVKGWLHMESFRPVKYQETSTGREIEKHRIINYQHGTPKFFQITPPLPENAIPKFADDWNLSVDPATALFTLVRDYRIGWMCNSEFVMFDGRRAVRFSLGEPVIRGEEMHCDSSYTLATSNSPRMDEQSALPLTLIYRPSETSPDKYELHRLTMQTSRGKITFKRI